MERKYSIFSNFVMQLSTIVLLSLKCIQLKLYNIWLKTDNKTNHEIGCGCPFLCPFFFLLSSCWLSVNLIFSIDIEYKEMQGLDRWDECGRRRKKKEEMKKCFYKCTLITLTFFLGCDCGATASKKKIVWLAVQWIQKVKECGTFGMKRAVASIPIQITGIWSI